MTPPSSPDRALRDALVRAGWIEARVFERLEPDRSRSLIADRLAAHVAQARESLSPLTPWPAQPERVTRILNDNANQVRIRRTLDYVMRGDRVLEIGVGFGYLCGLLLRDASIASYTGIDISKARLDAVHEMAAVNRLDAQKIETAHIDLMDLTPDWVADRAPTLILLEEVLEHVEDAETGLATLARCMTPESCVLFTLPLLGRVEACWGHLSLFDVPRVQRLVASAELTAQHVEVIHDAWLFVLASPSNDVPSRVVELASLPRPEPAAAAATVSKFVRANVRRAIPRPDERNSLNTEVVSDNNGAHVKVIGRRRKGTQSGGITFDIAGDVALRLELAFPKPRYIVSVHVDLRRGDRRIASWTWDTSSDRPHETLRTYVLRPGHAYGPLLPEGDVLSGRADKADVYIELSGAHTAEFSVRRAAAVATQLAD